MSLIVSSPKIEFSFGDLPVTCKILLLLSFVEAIGGGISYHIAYYFSVSTTFNKLNIGFLGFFMGVGAILGSIYGGYFTGKVKANNLIGMSFFLIGLSFFVLAKASTFYISLFFVFLMGFGINLFITCSNSTLLQISRNTNLSLSVSQSYKNALENAGGIGAMILIMLFAQNYFNSAMVLVGFSFILLSSLVFLKLDISNIDVNTILTIDNEKINSVYRSLIPMLFSVFCIGLTYGIQKTVLGIHLNETIASSLIIGFFFATDPVLIALFQVKLSKLVEKFNKHMVASIGCVLLGVSTFAMGISSTMLEMFCSLVVFTIGEMLFMAHSVALCHQYGSSNHSGLGIGAWRSAYALGMMIGPLISGLAMYYFDAQFAWTISSILCLISSILVINAKKQNL
ncbi:TPA: MFS transporter [Legionella pneumophila]|nr:MFS transporter [Legionella pneumophila]HBD7283636.1 MFS transporter [Legionella pneumophila]HEN8241155.1 MFS transporter [Legionella pneumophila]